MANRSLIFALLFLMLLTSQASALLDGSQTQVNSNPSNGIEVDYPKFDFIKNNQSFNLTVFTYNKTDGRILPGSNCSLQLFNHTGTKVYNVPNMTAYGTGYNNFIVNGNFTLNNVYEFVIYCENNGIGGFASGEFGINAVGFPLSVQQAIIYIIFFSFLVFLFVVNLIFITKLPGSNAKDPTGQIINVTNMKYVTGALVFIEYLFIVAMLFISSNIGKAYLQEQLFANFLFTLYRLSMRFIPVMIIGWLIWIGANVVNDREIKNMTSRGLPGSGKEKEWR